MLIPYKKRYAACQVYPSTGLGGLALAVAPDPKLREARMLLAGKSVRESVTAPDSILN